MMSFDYLRKANLLYNPRTPSTALRAVEDGLLPGEAFVYKAVSVKPLFEEPIDLFEVERLLAREDNDLQTNLLLIGIMEQLRVDPDSEVALFAAEGINAIENRYNMRIEALKEEYKKTTSTSALRNIAQQFFELALVNNSRPAIKRFYLAESYSYMRTLQETRGLYINDVVFVVRLLLLLAHSHEARRILAEIDETLGNDLRILLLQAEVEFNARNFHRVADIVGSLSNRGEELDDNQRQMLEQWTIRADE